MWLWCVFHHLQAIRDPLLLQLEGAPVGDVVADVFLVGQDLMDGGAGPGPAEIGQDSASLSERPCFRKRL